MLTRTILSIGLVALLGLGLSACSSAPSAESKPDAKAPAAVDLTGEWAQANEGSGSVHVATIVDDTLTIYWLSDDETKSLYWVGSIDAPDDGSDTFTWESVRDQAKTENALLASRDDSKEFAYDGEKITYETGALGVTWKVELKQTSTTPAAAPASETKSSSDFAVTIEGARFATDYEGKPVIVVSFGFTNNSDKAASFLWSVNAQAFQGGIEIDDIAIMDDDTGSLASADIKPGITATIEQPFLLRDNSPVTVDVSDMFTDAELASQELSVSQ